MGLAGGGLARWAAPAPGRPLTPPLPTGALALGLPLLGFTGAGIAGGSVAAKLMSWSAIAHGGGVPAGGMVATMQSLGESGARPRSRHRGHRLSLYLLLLSPSHRPAQHSEVRVPANRTGGAFSH